MCQALANELWVDAQNEYVLDIDYYHLVFTCPSELNALIYCSQKELYSLFFRAVAETLHELSKDPRFPMHVPPKGFIRIRHYGLISNHNKRRLIPICRNLIGCREFLRRFRKDDKVNAAKVLYKKDVTVYPYCGGAVSYEVCTGQTYRKSSA